MEPFDPSTLPIETRDWLARKAKANGYATTTKLVDDILRLLHELDADQNTDIERVLLERLDEPSTDMTEDDWAILRAELRARHDARKE